MEKDGAAAGGTGQLPRLELVSLPVFVLLYGLIAIFFGILIAAVFELFRLVDFLLAPPWEWGMSSLGRGLAVLLIGLFLARVAWRLSVALLGILTPKFDPPPLDNAPVVLDADNDSAFFDIVADICRLVGAPLPDEVRISYTAECYVAEQREFAFRPRRRLSLVLGLPQLLVLTVDELKVIIVHELAHFRTRDTTIVVFLFRFAESLRKALVVLRTRPYRFVDPLYWLFAAAYQFVLRLGEPIQRQQELNADEVSAAVYGGELAVHTLLKDWLLVNQFVTAVEEYIPAVGRGEMSGQGTVFRFFEDRWQDFSDAAREYLERRLVEEEPGEESGARPTMKTRIARMRAYPPKATPGTRPASQLLPDLPRIAEELHRQLWRHETLPPRDGTPDM